MDDIAFCVAAIGLCFMATCIGLASIYLIFEGLANAWDAFKRKSTSGKIWVIIIVTTVLTITSISSGLLIKDYFSEKVEQEFQEPEEINFDKE